jgi:Fe-S cluster assembly protein SufD
MAFEERIDVHSELYDVRTAAIKTLKIKDSNKRRSLEVHFAKCTLKNDFTVFSKHETLLSLSKKIFFMKSIPPK